MSTQQNTQTQTEADNETNGNGNHGVIDESDVFGKQFLQNNLEVENDEIDARHAFLLTSDHAGDDRTLIQVFAGIEREVIEIPTYNMRSWQDKSKEGHNIPEGAQSHYAAWRRSEPKSITKKDTVGDPFPDECYHQGEFLVELDEDERKQNMRHYDDDHYMAGYTLETSTELHNEWVSDLIFTAETEEEVFDRITALDNFVKGETDTKVRTIEPMDNPDNESELTQTSPGFFWSHIIGTPVLKLELNENGVYEPVAQVEYEWQDEDNRSKGVVRVN